MAMPMMPAETESMVPLAEQFLPKTASVPIMRPTASTGLTVISTLPVFQPVRLIIGQFQPGSNLLRLISWGLPLRWDTMTGAQAMDTLLALPNPSHRLQETSCFHCLVESDRFPAATILQIPINGVRSLF